MTQDAGDRRQEPQVRLLEAPASPHRVVRDTGGGTWEEQENEIDLNGEENIWSISEGDSTVWERENTWSRGEDEDEDDEDEDDIWSVDEEDLGPGTWDFEEELAAQRSREGETEEGSGHVELQEEMQLDDALDLEKTRQTLKLKKDRDAQQQRRMKEEKRKRKRLQHQKKLKKTLQEEMKRRNRLIKIIMNARAGRTRPPHIIFILADDLGESRGGEGAMSVG